VGENGRIPFDQQIGPPLEWWLNTAFVLSGHRAKSVKEEITTQVDHDDSVVAECSAHEVLTKRPRQIWEASQVADGLVEELLRSPDDDRRCLTFEDVESLKNLL
jgi:hypothetical protein